MAPPTLENRPLAASFGREVGGVALHELDAPTAAVLLDLLRAHKLLLLRRQSLSDAELAAATGLLGRVQPTNAPGNPAVPAVSTISNLRDADGQPIGGLGEGELAWHTDHAYRADPCTLALNHMLHLPHEGGETWFCDMVQGWEALPPELKVRAETLTGMYAANPNANTHDKGVAFHGLALRHPRGGRTSLYLSERSKELGLEGMEGDEGRSVIDAYLKYQLRPAHVYAHRWAPGDVLIWDGGQTLHKRTAFSGPRLMKGVRAHLPPEDFAVPQGRWEALDPATIPHWYFHGTDQAHYRA